MQIGDRVQYRGAGEFAMLGWGLVLGIEPVPGAGLHSVELLWHDGTILETFAHQLCPLEDESQ